MKNKLTSSHNHLIFAKRLNTNEKQPRFKSIKSNKEVAKIVFITTFPPRECGIATYSQDLILALNKKFKKSFTIEIVALELKHEKYVYQSPIYASLATDNSNSYQILANKINSEATIEIVLVQHEFGLFRNNEDDYVSFLNAIHKPKIVVFHTVLPNPNEFLKNQVDKINTAVDALVVMTNTSAAILATDYAVDTNKITVIPHGTHLVEHTNKDILKEKYHLSGRKIIATFGLLSSGKCIETSIQALQKIVKKQPEVLFLVIGKTHPTVVKNEGEIYREALEKQIIELGLQKNVNFINQYLPLDTLLEYLQLTDIYLFTSKDRNQAVSGTFSYAISCGCPIISTPIPHAVEVLQNGTGIIIDFENSDQLAKQVIRLLNDDELRNNIASNGIHKLAPTAWENSAIAHAYLFQQIANKKIQLHFEIPDINLNHFKKLTTPFGMIQFSKINQCDINSGYTLDDNARALVAISQHFELTNNPDDIPYIELYFNFIKFCFQSDGHFLNYVNEDKKFTNQNNENLDDANGRAIWALGHLIALKTILPVALYEDAVITLNLALKNAHTIHSTRAMAFMIKGLYYSDLMYHSNTNINLLKHFADKLVQMYQHESKGNWFWYESYLTYANSILPEAMLCAYLSTNDPIYKEIAKKSFDFLLSKIFRQNTIKVISNKGWLKNTEEINPHVLGGEQPIDVAYTILALNKFYAVFKEKQYLEKMEIGFSWFHGNNHLRQIIYNPCTGGCYDGLEDHYINLNQGAESTVSYLMARLTMEKQFKNSIRPKNTTLISIPKKIKDNNLNQLI